MSDTVSSDSVGLLFACEIEAYRLGQRERHFAELGVAMPPRRFADCSTHHTPGSRLPRRMSGNGVSVGDARRWLEICEILCRAADELDHETRRGWVIACRLLGLGWNETKNALSDVALFGAEVAAPHWAPYMGAADERFIGFVYTAEMIGQPEVVKIGFSRDPNRRMTELQRIRRRAVKLTAVRPGTMLHEWALHHHTRHQIEPEWYPAREIPSLLRSFVAEVA